MKENIEKALQIAKELDVEIPQKYEARTEYNKKLIKSLIPKWKRKKRSTFCGQLTSDFFIQAGYDMSPILREKSLWGINTTGQYQNAIDSIKMKFFIEVTAEQAFYLACIARPVLCLSPKTMVVHGIKHNHAAVIWPVQEKYNFEKGPKIAQQGWFSLINKHISHKYAWGKNWTHPMVKYFLPDLT